MKTFVDDLYEMEAENRRKKEIEKQEYEEKLAKKVCGAIRHELMHRIEEHSLVGYYYANPTDYGTYAICKIKRRLIFSTDIINL
jgi:hypothetical protein